MKMESKDGVAIVTSEMIKDWQPAFEAHLGAERYASLPDSRKSLITAIAQSKAEGVFGVGFEAATYVNGDNVSLAPTVQSPTAGAGGVFNNGLVATPGTSGSGDRQYLIGLCIAIAAKTIGLEMVQTVPATSQNITVQFLSATYQGGSLTDAKDNIVNVVTMGFAAAQNFKAGTKYVLGDGAIGAATNFLEVTFVKDSRSAGFSYIFTVGNHFTATNTTGTLSDIAYTGAGTGKPIGTLVSTGNLFSITSDMATLSAAVAVASVENTKAIENYVPHQTTNGLNRTLTRSEADAGTDRTMNLELRNENYVIGNRTLNGHVARLQYKQLQAQGIDPLQYLVAAMKNEVSQEINWQIITAVRAYGLTNALEYEDRGSQFNTYIGPKTVASVAFNTLPLADQLFDKDQVAVASKFAAMDNLINTMQYETIESVGTYLAMLITQAAYAIGTDSRYGEGDGVVLGSALAGFLAACTSFTKLADKDADMTKNTGAKLSGTLNGIKVYVDVQTPHNCPYVSVFRSNQDVKVDMPGIDGDNILVPGLAYLVKDLISSTELVPEGTGGKKIIIDSETDLVAVGERPWAGYLTFAFYVAIPGLTTNV